MLRPFRFHEFGLTGPQEPQPGTQLPPAQNHPVNCEIWACPQACNRSRRHGPGAGSKTVLGLIKRSDKHGMTLGGNHYKNDVPSKRRSGTVIARGSCLQNKGNQGEEKPPRKASAPQFGPHQAMNRNALIVNDSSVDAGSGTACSSR